MYFHFQALLWYLRKYNSLALNFMLHLWVASSLFFFLSFRSATDTRIFRVPWISRRTRGERSSDLWFGTLFLFLCGIRLHSLLLSQNWKPTSALLHTELSFSFFSFYQPITSNACIYIFVVCVISRRPEQQNKPRTHTHYWRQQLQSVKRWRERRTCLFTPSRPGQLGRFVCLLLLLFMLLLFFTKFDP